jgi:DNA-binding SARP family transcriptional activator
MAVTAPPFDEWLRDERERLRELAVQVLARLLAAQMRAGSFARAVERIGNTNDLRQRSLRPWVPSP